MSAVPPAPQKVYEFESSFASVTKPSAGEVLTNLFHRVAELLSEACLHFQTALVAGKLPAAGLLSHCRGLGACAEPTLQAAAPFNSSWSESSLQTAAFGSSPFCCSGSKSWGSHPRIQPF